MTLTFNPLRAMVMTYSHAKGQGQRSVGSEDRVGDKTGRTGRQTDGGDCITSHANADGTKHDENTKCEQQFVARLERRFATCMMAFALRWRTYFVCATTGPRSCRSCIAKRCMLCETASTIYCKALSVFSSNRPWLGRINLQIRRSAN